MIVVPISVALVIVAVVGVFCFGGSINKVDQGQLQPGWQGRRRMEADGQVKLRSLSAGGSVILACLVVVVAFMVVTRFVDISLPTFRSSPTPVTSAAPRLNYRPSTLGGIDDE